MDGFSLSDRRATAAHGVCTHLRNPWILPPSPLAGEGLGERGIMRKFKDMPLSLALSRKGRGDLCAYASGSTEIQALFRRWILMLALR